MANRLYKPVYQIWPTRNLIGEFGSGKAAHLAPQGPLGPVLTQWQNLWHKVAEHSGKGQQVLTSEGKTCSLRMSFTSRGCRCARCLHSHCDVCCLIARIMVKRNI